MQYRNARFNQLGTIDCELEMTQGEWVPATLRPDTDNPAIIELYNQALTDPETAAHVIDFDTAKADKLAEIETAYNAAIYGNIEYMGTTFQADKESQDLIDKTLSPGQVPDGFAWYDLFNSEIPMTYSELQGFSMALLIRGQTAFVARRMLKNQVEAAQTVEDLGLITVEINP